MQRIRIAPRRHWQGIVEAQGLTYHTVDDQPYWHESAYYRLTSAEVDALEKAANDLHLLCIEAADAVIKRDWFARLAIPPAAIPVILESWERDDFSLYGRFDFAYDPKSGPPKMLEYNADTPTALVEAAVAQWYWMQDEFKSLDQFNSLHERLVAAWKKFQASGVQKVHLGGIKDHLEDAQTVLYLEDTCHQAGLAHQQLFIEDLGWDASQKALVDLEDQRVEAYFKLYPWEWMWAEDFAEHLTLEPCRMIEPAWKMLLSNKGLLPVLWELYPDHPNLLPAWFADELPATQANYVLKPLLGREGANVRVVRNGATVQASEGLYGQEGYVAQAFASTGDYDGYHPVMGVWMIDHTACGLGIREDQSLVTGNTSLFTPHVFG